MKRCMGALWAVILLCLATPMPAQAATSSNSVYAICQNQTYALCASASAFVYAGISYAKCIIKAGNSISLPPLTYQTPTGQKNICDMNAAGAANGYMMSTFSLPDEIRKGGSKALYTCPGGATAGYAQCDGGTCFKSTTGRYFPGVGKVAANEIICSCPITTPDAKAPVGYQFVGPYPCQQQAFSACNQTVDNGSIIPVGSPPGAGRILTQLLYGQNYVLNECFSK